MIVTLNCFFIGEIYGKLKRDTVNSKSYVPTSRTSSVARVKVVSAASVVRNAGRLGSQMILFGPQKCGMA